MNYTYDGDGLRVEKSSGTLYWRSYAGQVLEETNTSGTMQRDYVFGVYPEQSRRTRYYNPRLGRFMSADPPRFLHKPGAVRVDRTGSLAGEISNPPRCLHGYGAVRIVRIGPQSLNRYSYVLNNPESYVDPSGMLVTEPNGCVIDGAGQTHCQPPGGDLCTVIFTSDSLWLSWDGGASWEEMLSSDELDVNCPYSTVSLGNPTFQSAKSKPKPQTPASGPCAAIAGKGGTILGPTSFGDVRFQFNAQGALTGLGIPLTGSADYVAPGLDIPANTYAGYSLTGPATVQLGFSNPVYIGSGFSQAFIQTATFSGGRYTSVNGAYAIFGIPLGGTTSPSSILLSALNGNSSALQVGGDVESLATLLSQNVNCQDIFGGGGVQ